MPDYGIQQVEQAEYQLPKNFGVWPGVSYKNPLIWTIISLILLIIYHKTR